MKLTPARLLYIVLIASLLAACAPPAMLGAPVGLISQDEQATPELVQAPLDATPTPTPFRPISPTPAFLPTETPTPSPTPTSIVDAFLSPEQLEQVPGQVNILLLGTDQRPWQKGKKFRTDTIILGTLNKELGTLNLTSFPRDLYIDIPGRGLDRINSAYVYGGIDLLFQTFKENFGVRPDHYVLVNFFNFKQFIDELEGLDVEVSEEVSDYREGYWTTIPAGMVHMDADTVLWYVRTRKTTNDFARNRRQQEVLKAVMEEVLTLENITRLPELYDIYKDMVVTDMGLGDLLPLVPLVLKLTDGGNINRFFIGPKQVSDWITPGGAMVLVPDMNAVRKIIRKSQNIP